MKVNEPPTWAFAGSKRQRKQDEQGDGSSSKRTKEEHNKICMAANEQKDAVFSSFFDIDALYSKTDSYGLKFDHHIRLLPGLKTVRLTGTLKKIPITTAYSSSKVTSSKSGSLQISSTKVLEAEIIALKKELQSIYNEKYQDFLSHDLKAKKKELEDKRLIKEIRLKRRLINFRLQKNKESLANAKTMLYNIQKDIDDSPHDKVENIDPIDPNNTSFSGTDNGLVTVTETVGFSLERFRYHLNLYHNSRIFGSAQQDNIGFIPLPKSFQIKGNAIDHNSGQKRYRKMLERRKRLKEHAEPVEGEMEQRDMNYYTTTNASTLTHALTFFKKTRAKSRLLYCSPSVMKHKYRFERSKKKYLDRLCSKERRFGSPGKKKLVMFIGDRGHGIGSRIKGYKKYGGKWKPKIHRRYATVCITNEHNSSQTCVYCFQKVIHPLKIENTGTKITAKEVNGSFMCPNPYCILSTVGKQCQRHLYSMRSRITYRSYMANTTPSPEKPMTIGRASLVKRSNAQTPKVQKPATSPVPADVILDYEPTLSASLVQPRGLINFANNCYMNVSLQTLLHCPPFCSLIQTISTRAAHSLSLVNSLNELINEFQKVDENGPVSPENVYDALLIQGMFNTSEFRQEDSQEFLFSLLDATPRGVEVSKQTQGGITHHRDLSGTLSIYNVSARPENYIKDVEYYSQGPIKISKRGLLDGADGIRELAKEHSDVVSQCIDKNGDIVGGKTLSSKDDGGDTDISLIGGGLLKH